MVATVLHPRAVPITIPSTSPMAHPVRQCAVAEKAIRLSELFQVAINVLPVRVYRYHYIPLGGTCKYGLQGRVYCTPLPYTEAGGASYLRRVVFDGWSVSGGTYTRLWCEILASGRGGTLAIWVLDSVGGSARRRGSRPRGGRGGLGRRFLLGRHLCRRHRHVRPVGRDGCDGDAHGEGEDRGR